MKYDPVNNYSDRIEGIIDFAIWFIAFLTIIGTCSLYFICKK